MKSQYLEEFLTEEAAKPKKKRAHIALYCQGGPSFSGVVKSYDPPLLVLEAPAGPVTIKVKNTILAYGKYSAPPTA